MAGFQVTINGRFWVTAEGLKRLAWSLKGAIPDWVWGDDSLGEPAALPTAQAIRLWLRLHLAKSEPGCLEAAKAAGAFLLKAQDQSDDPRRKGGFLGESPSTQRLALSVSATAASVCALYELSDVVENPQIVLDPAQPRYTGFDRLL